LLHNKTPNFSTGGVGRVNLPRNASFFAQRTNETGQAITQEALDYVYEQSQGQPWIVNSLFKRATMRVLDADSTETVTVGHIQEARKQMIEARETHLDSLGVRLRDPRIRKVIQTIMTGEFDLSITRTNPDVELAMDLGLVAWSPQTNFTIANPIYDELLTRYLDAPYHDNLPPSSTWQWENPDGTKVCSLCKGKLFEHQNPGKMLPHYF
jgi:hypothetical protein